MGLSTEGNVEKYVGKGKTEHQSAGAESVAVSMVCGIRRAPYPRRQLSAILMTSEKKRLDRVHWC